MRRLWMKLWAAFCLLVGFMPLFALVGAATLPNHPALWAALPGISACIALLAGLLPKKLRAPASVLGLFLFLAAAVCLLPRAPWTVYLTILPSALLYLLLARAMPGAPGEEWTINRWLAGLALHLIGLIVSHYLFPALQPALGVAFALYVVLFLLFSNRVNLDAASAREGSRAPAPMRRRNRRYVLAIAAVALIVAFARPLGRALRAALVFVRDCILTAVAFLGSLLPFGESMGGGAGGGGGFEDIGGMEAAETSPFWEIMSKIFIALALLLAAAGLCFALWKGFLALRRLLKRLMEKLRSAYAGLGEAYQERAESVFDWGEIVASGRTRVESLQKRLRRPPRWSAMNSRERVRAVYAAWRKKRAVPQELTAREALSEARLSDIYDIARYSEHPVTDAEAETIRRELS